jgi:hypothetical protein
MTDRASGAIKQIEDIFWTVDNEETKSALSSAIEVLRKNDFHEEIADLDEI